MKRAQGAGDLFIVPQHKFVIVADINLFSPSAQHVTSSTAIARWPVFHRRVYVVVCWPLNTVTIDDMPLED
ncbi:MAG: hypothetical protein CMO44_15935 [Verrucomicrobiales bacterium]|nr:hypothetical protein [Verrucomicrobiales bacterium]